MKVIFLDIDGVLVTKKHLLALDAEGKRMMDEHHRHHFDPECVANLRRILDATNAKIVLSSVWRMFGKELFDTMWKERGCPGEIMDFTPKKMSSNRGDEIWLWLNDQDRIGLVESFVIIDDDTWDLHRDQMSRTVQTTWENGLTDDATEKAINILNFVEL